MDTRRSRWYPAARLLRRAHSYLGFSGAGIWAFAALASLAALALQAAEQPFGYNVWTADDGLPQNVIRGVYQDSQGYLWVATLDGLARFDGVRFVLFDKNGTEGIRSSRFSAIHGAENGDIWLSTDGGGVTVYSKGKFRTFTTKDGLPHLFIRSVTGDDAGNIWVLASDRVLAWNAHTEQFEDAGPSMPAGYWDELGWSGGFWRVDEEGVHCFYRGEWRHLPLPEGKSSSNVRNVARQADGTVWVRSTDDLLWKAPSTAEAFVRVDGAARYTHRDRLGRSWKVAVGELLTRQLMVPDGGGSHTVPFLQLLEDREGSIWLASEGEGLFQLRPQFIRSYSTESGLATRNVYPILQDHNGSVWVGGWRHGLSRFDGTRFRVYGKQEGLPGTIITALAEDRRGRLWVASNDQLGVWNGTRFVVPDGRAVAERIVPPERAMMVAIVEDAKGEFWIGTTRGLLRSDGRHQTFYTTRNGLATDDVRVILPARDGSIWVGGYGGLSRLRDGRFEAWKEEDGLPGSSIRTLYEDSDGVLWIGSYDGGLGRFHQGKFTRYTTHNGLFNNGVFQILEDLRGNFWMSSNRGIYRVSRADLDAYARGERAAISSVAYGRADGMRNVECNGGFWPAGVTARDGRMWFPTQDGVAVVDPEGVPVNPQAPRVTIESVHVEGVDQALGSSVRIGPGRRSFEVQYTALSLVNSREIRFRYKLEGLDSHWTEAGQRRSAYYAHVPPGDYRFLAMARNSDGVWSTAETELGVEVEAAFYQTRWFAVATLSGVLLLVAAAWRYRVSQLTRIQQVQHAYARQLIASQERERKRIAAELHDSIGQRLVVVKNLALFFLRERRDDENADERYAAIEEISTEASLAIYETREISYNLRPFQLDRLGLTRAVESMVRTASATGVPIAVDLCDIDDAFPEDLRINFYRIVQECLNNILKHSSASEASVRVRRKDDKLVLTIRDNGTGFSASARSGDSRGGFGLVGLEERASLLGGSIRIESSPGKGSVVTATLPTLAGIAAEREAPSAAGVSGLSVENERIQRDSAGVEGDRV